MLIPDPLGNGLVLALGHDGAFELNDWSFTQLCGLAGVSKDTVNRLSAETASRVFRETMPEGNKPLQLFTTGGRCGRSTGTATRGSTTPTSWRCSWSSPSISSPPRRLRPAGRASTCGEQDMFAFLIDPTGWAEIGGEAFAPGSSSGTARSGSDRSGSRHSGTNRFARNHIVWDAAEVVEFTRKHTGKVGEALSDIRRIVEELVTKRDARRDGFAAVIRKAMEQTLGEDAEEAMRP